MGQVLHGSATTTEAVRRAIQHNQESLRVPAKRFGVNPKDDRQVEVAKVSFAAYLLEIDRLAFV
jgi:hypothetical protein